MPYRTHAAWTGWIRGIAISIAGFFGAGILVLRVTGGAWAGPVGDLVAGVATTAAAMFLVAAVALVAAARSLAASAEGRPEGLNRWITLLGAATLLAGGIASLALQISDPGASAPGVEFQDSEGSPTSAMASLTALSFIGLGAALLLAIGRGRRPVLLEWLTLGGVGLAFLAIEVSVFGRALFGALNRPPALPSAWTLLFLNLAILSLRHDGRIVGLLTGDGLAGSIARRIIPIVVVVPNVVGWLAIHAWRNEWLGLEAVLALSSVIVMTTLGATAWRCIEIVHQSERQRQDAEHLLRESEGRFRAMADDAPVIIWTAAA